MKLHLIGHDYKYTVEQMLITMFPDERPEYPAGLPDGDRAEISLFAAREYHTARCVIYIGGEPFAGRARARVTANISDLDLERRNRKIVSLSFFRAALRAGREKPVWGSLTGVRPAKLARTSLLSGMSGRRVEAFLSREYGLSRERAALCVDASLAGIAVGDRLKPGDVCLYVGIPFCPSRCAYCSFVSNDTKKSANLIEPFLDALFLEIEASAKYVKKLNLRPISIYIGGGTPTSLSEIQLKILCAHLAACFDLSSVTDYTVEAGRPDTITAEKIAVLKSCGVNRVSVNPQSMDDRVLSAIGRGHKASDVQCALHTVRQNSGMAINMDLIAGLPADDVSGFKKTLDSVIKLSPENITVHTLSLKNGADMKAASLALPTPPMVGAMLDEAMRELRASGYSPYYLYRQKFMSGGFENVGWCKKGFLNLYNVCIMEELCSIISMGGGASTKLVSPKGRIERLFAPKYPKEYIAGIEKTIAAKNKIEVFYNGI